MTAAITVAASSSFVFSQPMSGVPVQATEIAFQAVHAASSPKGTSAGERTKAPGGRAIAIVAHGGTNRALICRALGLSAARLLAIGQDYGALTVLERTDGAWRLRHLNERPAL